MPEKEVKTIEDKQEIDKIIEEKIKGRKLIFSDWYKIGILKKGIPEEKFDEIFPQFDKIFAIEIEILTSGNIGYELFYKLSNNTSFSIATIPKNNNLLIIHLIEYKRNLDYRFKKFKKV
ncbi:MAG: hypothetical protein WCX73_04805 [Candidatus Pacearchaeota archaeon]|jgi:hypothetical protein